jgi:hypothetical protein
MRTVKIFVSRNRLTKKPQSRAELAVPSGVINQRPDIEVAVEFDDSIIDEPIQLTAKCVEDIENMAEDGSDLPGLMFKAGEEMELSRDEEDQAVEVYFEGINSHLEALS